MTAAATAAISSSHVSVPGVSTESELDESGSDVSSRLYRVNTRNSRRDSNRVNKSQDNGFNGITKVKRKKSQSEDQADESLSNRLLQRRRRGNNTHPDILISIDHSTEQSLDSTILSSRQQQHSPQSSNLSPFESSISDHTLSPSSYSLSKPSSPSAFPVVNSALKGTVAEAAKSLDQSTDATGVATGTSGCDSLEMNLPEEQGRIDEVRQDTQVKETLNDDTESRIPVTEANATTHEEEQQSKEDALALLTQIEEKFSHLREKLFKSHVSRIDREAETIYSGKHPGISEALQDLEQKHQQRLASMKASFLKRQEAIRAQCNSAVHASLSDFTFKKRHLYSDMLQRIQSNRFQVDFERRRLQSEQDELLRIPPTATYGHIYLNDDTRIRHRNQRLVDIREWVDISQQGGFSCSSMSVLSENDIQDDLALMSLRVSLDESNSVSLGDAKVKRKQAKATKKRTAAKPATPDLNVKSDRQSSEEMSPSSSFEDLVAEATYQIENEDSEDHLHSFKLAVADLTPENSFPSSPTNFSVSQAAKVSPFDPENVPSSTSSSDPSPTPSKTVQSSTRCLLTPPLSDVLIGDDSLHIQGHTFRTNDRAVLSDNGAIFSVKLVSISASEIIAQRPDGSKTKIPVPVLIDGRVKLEPKI